jgi:hypothetical protein
VSIIFLRSNSQTPFYICLWSKSLMTTSTLASCSVNFFMVYVPGEGVVRVDPRRLGDVTQDVKEGILPVLRPPRISLHKADSCLFNKNGRSANKFRKSQIRKFADLNHFVRFADLPQIWHCADFRIADPIIFMVFWPNTSASQQIHTFPLTNLKYNILIQSTK